MLDWELAHAGDPAEDIGWLCAPAWRFGGPGEVGGFGRLDDLLDAYREAGGGTVTPARVHWWQVYATVKWAVICALQAATHLNGLTRSVELAAIGRRVCESEWDLFVLLGVTPPAARPGPEPAVGPLPPFGRPSAAELVEAVREYLDGVTERGEGAAGFEARVARNALSVVERELRLGPALAGAHAARLAELGFDDDAGIGCGAARRDARRGLGHGGTGTGRVGPRPAAGGQPLLLAGRDGVERRRRCRRARAETDASATSVRRVPMPWRTAPASRLTPVMKSQAWWNAGTAAAPVAEPKMATRQATPRATPIWRDMA